MAGQSTFHRKIGNLFTWERLDGALRSRLMHPTLLLIMRQRELVQHLRNRLLHQGFKLGMTLLTLLLMPQGR